MRQRDIRRQYGSVRVTFWTSAVGSRLVSIEEGRRITIIYKEEWDRVRKTLDAAECARSLLDKESSAEAQR